MESYNHSANRKRKLSKSKQQQEDLKRKTNKSNGCFGRCYTRKKHENIPIEKEKILEESNADKIRNEQVVPMPYLTRSPLYNETTFCLKTTESFYDPCIECTVQYGPDIYENLPRNFQSINKELNDSNKSISMEQFDIFPNEIKNNVNSFVNNIIGDGVDRISEIIRTNTSDQYKGKEFIIDNKLSTHSGHQYLGLVFEKQKLKKTSQTSHRSSVDLPGNDRSLPSNILGYDWNLATNFDQESSSRNQEPYNWDYQWPSSSVNSTSKIHLIDNCINNTKIFPSDNSSINSSYSITSVLVSNKPQNSNISLNISHQQKSSSNLSQENNLVPTINSSHVQLSRTIVNEIDTKQSENITSINTEDQTIPTKVNNTVASVHSTYDDIMNIWRYLFERFLNFMLPSTHNTTDENINLSSSIITSNTHSWSTLTSVETQNMNQSDNIGPWWGRRDVDDQTPATFIFTNEPLSTWYSIGMIAHNRQMDTSIKNRLCYSKYCSYPKTCHCCSTSSINLNNRSSSS
ncbi:unnamed protein product [Adineta steineri]|uniref:Uncharacterized protein n=1 Tax=Adineta steineri TaxID=433720 RepID=A0A818JGZ6_9BILA|nr:unnamed protein product [Adineta steineri]